MTRKVLAILALAAFVTAANADITAYLTEWQDIDLPDVGPAFYADVHVVVSNGDDWTVGGMNAYVDTGWDFYQDSMNDGNPPNPNFFGFVPQSEWTSFYTSPGDWPNAPYDGGIVGVALMQDGPQQLRCDWFDTIDTGDGDFIVARITVVPDYNPGVIIGAGVFQYASANDAQLKTLEFAIPEPTTLALLALGGLAVLRRK